MRIAIATLFKAGLFGPGHLARLIATETVAGNASTAAVAAQATANGALPKAGGTMTGVGLSTVVPIAYAASVQLDLTAGQLFNVADLTGGITFTNPASLPVGYQGMVFTKQDGTGSRSIGFGTSFTGYGNTTPNTAAGKWNVIVLSVPRAGVLLYTIGSQD